MASLNLSTAYNRTFFMVSSADHISPATGISPSVTISKNTASFASAAGNVSEIGSGWYWVALTTVDTNTSGDLAYHITGSGADNTDFNDQIGVTTSVNVTQWSGGNVTASTSGIPDVNAKNINNVAAATPGAAGGILISGSNAGTTTFGNITVTGTTTTTITGNITGNLSGNVGNVTGTAAVNASQVNGNATSATNLAITTRDVLRGTVTTGGNTTSIPTSALTGATVGSVNQFGNRTILFDSNTTTTGLQGAVASISASTNSATPTFTVSTLPASPVSGDTFSII